MIVLDTDIVTLFSFGKTDKLNERISKLEEGEELVITVITQMEVLRGRFDSIKNAADQEELKVAMKRFLAAEKMLADFDRLDVSDAAREHFESLLKGKKTKKMRRTDLLIACIALAQKALLVTRNTKDFKNVPGLRIENWAD